MARSQHRRRCAVVRQEFIQGTCTFLHPPVHPPGPAIGMQVLVVKKKTRSEFKTEPAGP